MRVEKASDLIYWTYFMMRWDEVEQSPTDKPCVQCGKAMAALGPVEDAKGEHFEGLVCHDCKRVIWVRKR